MNDRDTTAEQRLARLGTALSHPLRVRILFALFDQEEVSPSDLHAEPGEPLGNVVYHVRALERLRYVEQCRTQPRRGALEHFFTLTDEMREILPGARRLVE